MYWLIPLAAQALANKDKQQAAPGKLTLPTYQTPQGMPSIERPVMPEPWQPEPLPPMQMVGAPHPVPIPPAPTGMPGAQMAPWEPSVQPPEDDQRKRYPWM